MSLSILPIDLQLEIFSYLPCKTIMSFMVLSHLHRSLLISPYFISKHHNKSRSKFFVLLPSSICLCEDDDHLTLFQNLMLPFVHCDFGNNIIGICNGIICMQMDGAIFFINPMIRYYFNLSLHYDDDEDESIYSYGFISRGLSDYLVVKIESDTNYYSGNDEGESIPLPKAWVYTYVENDWRPLEVPGSICTTSTNLAYNGVVYHGLLHWGAQKWVEHAWYYFILTFDPQTEVFGELLLADSLTAAIHHPNNDRSGVFVIQNSTKPLTVHSFFLDESYYTVAVWVMDRYGITESWAQIFTFNFSNNYISTTLFGFNPDIHMRVGFPFLLFHRSDDTLFFGVEFNGQYSLRSLDISHGTFTVLTHNVRRTCENFCIGYSPPSLVLLDKVSASRY